jgi:hypothetical protein
MQGLSIKKWFIYNKYSINKIILTGYIILFPIKKKDFYEPRGLKG